MTRSLLVEAAGPGATVQDLGRPGLAHLGVTTAGAADRAALRLANRLVGNPQGAAAVEVTLGGLTVRTGAALTVAVTGASCPVDVDGRPHPRRAVLSLPAGARLRLGPAAAGVRAYLAVRGGLAVAPVLGSRSRDTLSGLGPAPLRPGDRLPVGTPAGDWPNVDVAPLPELLPGPAVLRAVPGPWPQAWGEAALRALFAHEWRVAADSDRIGLRLEGGTVLDAASIRAAVPGSGADAPARSWPSAGLLRGAIQVPPDGRPVVFGADHPVTGGYPVLACLLDADTDRAAQLRPGQGVRLKAPGY